MVYDGIVGAPEEQELVLLSQLHKQHEDMTKGEITCRNIRIRQQKMA
jgi:hypothetical protein